LQGAAGSEKLRKPEDITKFDIQRTHWVVMNGPFTRDPIKKTWSCPVNTWGGKGNRAVETSESKISSSIFGFIAVDMKEQLRKPPPGGPSAAATPVTVGAGGP